MSGDIKMKLTLIRHGQTDVNLQKKVQGWTNHPLNETGIKQALRIRSFYEMVHKRFDVVISSPLKRAYDTAKYALGYKKDLDILIDYHFIERDFGVFEDRNVDEVMPIILEKNFTYKGYEDDKMLLKRIENGLISLYEKYENKDVVIFCHSHVIKSFLILSDKKYNFKTLLDNASIHTLSYDGNRLKVLEFNRTV